MLNYYNLINLLEGFFIPKCLSYYSSDTIKAIALENLSIEISKKLQLKKFQIYHLGSI